MSSSAHTALVISVLASALGALVMCLLVARYGLAPAKGEDGERGLLITRFGHALAGVCFAATGILTVVALSVPAREARSAAPTTIVKVEPDRAAEAKVQALASEMKTLAGRVDQAEARMAAVDSATRRLDQAESRMAAMDATTRRLGDEVGSISAHAKQLERAIAALPRRPVVAEPAPKATPSPPATVEVTPAPPAPAPVPATPPATPPPAPMPEPAAAPKPRAPEPAAHRPVAPPPRVAEPPTTPRVAASSGRATIEAPARGAEGGAAVTKPDDVQLTDKIRDDWKTIRGGLATAGDDFKAAVRDLGRKLWR